jgi:hypothetical protein
VSGKYPLTYSLALFILAMATDAAAAGSRMAPELATLASEPGWGILVDTTGRLCFVDTDEDVLWRLDALGRPSALARGLRAHDLYLNPSGGLEGDEIAWDPFWHAWRRGIWQINPAGQRLELYAPVLHPGAGAGLLVDRRGSRYGFAAGGSSSPKEALYRLSPDGPAALVAGGGAGQADGRGSTAGFEAVRAVRWGGDGALYAADGAAVRRIALDGRVTTLGRAIPAGPRGPWPHLLGIDVAAQRVAAADYGGGRVLGIAPSGAVSTLFRSGPGWAPSGVVASGDSLYILEYRSPGWAGRLLSHLGPHLRVWQLRAGEARPLASVWSPDALPLAVMALAYALAIVAGAILAPLAYIQSRRRPAAPADGPSLCAHGPWNWLSGHVFKVVTWVTLLLTLVLLGREVFQPATDAVRLGTLAVILLVTALSAQVGPGILDRIKRIGPVEMIERSHVPVEAVDSINLTMPVEEEGLRLQRRLLPPSQQFAYKQADLLISLVQHSGQEITDDGDKQRYFRLLMLVGSVALVVGDAQRSISRLRFLQDLSLGCYESSKVPYTLAIAHMVMATEEKERRREHLRAAVDSFLTVVTAVPDHYQAYFYLAFVEDDLGNYGSAVAYNQKAIEIRPQLAAAKYNLAISLQKATRTEDAWQALESIRPGDDEFAEAAKLARDDEDLAPFRTERLRFEALALAQANPPPF